MLTKASIHSAVVMGSGLHRGDAEGAAQRSSRNGSGMCLIDFIFVLSKGVVGLAVGAREDFGDDKDCGVMTRGSTGSNVTS